jgi:hypothetical protein
MQKFILKNLIFFSPIILTIIITGVFYSTEKGDLLRIGYLFDLTGKYRKIYSNEFEQEVLFKDIQEFSSTNTNRINVLTLGDSFSEQSGYGYKNYLAQDERFNVLHYPRSMHENPIRTLYGIINGDILEKISIDYIILQSVERDVVKRAKGIDQNYLINFDSLIHHDNEEEKQKTNIFKKFVSQNIIKFIIYNLCYLIDDNAFFSMVYKTPTVNKLFSHNTNNILFFCDDLNAVEENNDSNLVAQLNKELNLLSRKLKDKGIGFIVIVSPDKFDLYYDYMVKKGKYTKPLFYYHFDKLYKEYLYLDSKTLLSDLIKKQKDVYFYDDSHWSPWATRLLSCELSKIINNDIKYR